MDDYSRNRRNNTDVSGELEFSTSTDDTTLVTGKTGWSIYIQRIVLTIKTDNAATMTFLDTNSSAVQVEKSDASPGANTQYIWDFLSKGKKLTEGKNFAMDVSATGLAGHIAWEGYMKQTGSEYLRAAGSYGQGQVFA